MSGRSFLATIVIAVVAAGGVVGLSLRMESAALATTSASHPYRSFVTLSSLDGGSPPPAVVPNVAGDGPLPAPVATSMIIGYSVQGRPIEAFTIGTGETTLVLNGGLNTGAENVTSDIVVSLYEHYRVHASSLPPNLRLVFVPLINPDGYVARTRTNARGVDLNRNWPAANWQPSAVVNDIPVSGGPAPLSEPETRALHGLLLGLRPDLIVTSHGFAALVEANEEPLAAALGRAYAERAGYDYIEKWTFYPITGELIVEMEESGLAAFDVELGYEADPFARNLPAIEMLIQSLPGG